MSRSKRLTRIIARAGAVLAVVTAAAGAQAAFTAPPSAPSSVVTVDPVRILDTRNGTGVTAAGPLGPGATLSLQVTGVGSFPANATGVIVTLTATEATAASFVTAWPSGQAQPTTSVLNFTAGEDIANTVTMSLGTGGKIDLFNSAGTVHLLADVTGYLLPATSGPTGPTVVTAAIELNAYSAASLGTVSPSNFGCMNLGTNGELFLDVPLPHGAAPQRVTFRWFDTDGPANITMLLQETAGGFPGTPGGALAGSQTASTGSAGYGTSTVNPTGADTVSDTVRYQIGAFTLGQGGGGVHMFCGATVEYAMVVP